MSQELNSLSCAFVFWAAKICQKNLYLRHVFKAEKEISWISRPLREYKGICQNVSETAVLQKNLGKWNLKRRLIVEKKSVAKYMYTSKTKTNEISKITESEKGKNGMWGLKLAIKLFQSSHSKFYNFGQVETFL